MAEGVRCGKGGVGGGEDGAAQAALSLLDTPV
jgi:hypothetical protein